MTIWSDRVNLARKGWHTKFGINRNGIASSSETSVACGFWANTNYWKGWLTDICIHDHVIVDLTEDGAYEKIASIASSVFNAISRAEVEFADSVPCINGTKDAHGRLELFDHSRETEYAYSRERTYFPTEDIPEDIHETAITQGPDHLENLISAARGTIWTTDHINPYFGHARHARDCLARKWGSKIRMSKRLSGETKNSFHPREMTVESLNEQLLAPMIGSFQSAIEDSFALYAPGGARHGSTSNGLPPGEQSLADALAERNITPST
jgi:hypothetical protein